MIAKFLFLMLVLRNPVMFLEGEAEQDTLLQKLEYRRVEGRTTLPPRSVTVYTDIKIKIQLKLSEEIGLGKEKLSCLKIRSFILMIWKFSIKKSSGKVFSNF